MPMTPSLNILFMLFTEKYEGTFYRAFPWAVYLVSRGYRVTICCTSKTHRFRKEVSEEQGVRILEMPALFSGRRVMTRLCGMYGWGPLDIFSRYGEVVRGNYDLVHTFEHHVHVVLPVLLAGEKKVPVWIADSCDHYGKGGLRAYEYSPYRLHRLYDLIGFPFRLWMDHLEVVSHLRADAVTVISTFLEQRALQQGVAVEKIFRIPGSSAVETISVQSKKTSRARLGLEITAHYALFFGAGQFDVDFSLEAFARVLEAVPNSWFVVVGKVDRAVSDRAAQLGILARLIQTGWVDDDELSVWLGCADVCLLPMKDNASNHARWPNKIGFYMAAGRPVVATDVNDVGPLIRRAQMGRVCSVDVDAFAHQIIDLFEHSHLAEQMGLCARELAKKEFALSLHGRALEQLYLQFVKEAR